MNRKDSVVFYLLRRGINQNQWETVRTPKNIEENDSSPIHRRGFKTTQFVEASPPQPSSVLRLWLSMRPLQSTAILRVRIVSLEVRRIEEPSLRESFQPWRHIPLHIRRNCRLFRKAIS